MMSLKKTKNKGGGGSSTVYGSSTSNGSPNENVRKGQAPTTTTKTVKPATGPGGKIKVGQHGGACTSHKSLNQVNVALVIFNY